MKFLLSRSALSAAILLSLPALASAASESEAPKDIGTVQVTANRIEQPVEETLASVTVIDRADIERSQSPDLSDLLARQAGIDVVRTGGPGSANTVFMRGSNSKHTLVLIDGLRVNSVVQGLFDFAHLPLSQIERIEIVRGPRAALWGSDAIGGVIQIFTRDPRGSFIELRGGSEGRRGADAGFAIGSDRLRFGAAFGHDQLDGFSAANPASVSYDPDRDGYRNTHGNFRLVGDIGTQRFSASALVADAFVEFDTGVSDVLTRQLGVSLQGDLRQNWSHQLNAGLSTEDIRTDSFGITDFHNRRMSLDWLHQFRIAEGQSLQAGLNWSRETGESKVDWYGEFFDEERDNLGLFAAYIGEFGAHTLNLSLRHDDNSQFGGATTGNAAWGLRIGETLRLRAGWGQGFHAPTLNDLYFPNVYGCCRGNADLRPEYSTNQELGLDWTPANGHQLGLSLFRNRIRDLIELDAGFVEYININRARVHGAELQYGWRRGAFSLDANATWQDARDLGNDTALLRRPKRKLNVGADYRFDNGFSLGLDAAAVGPRPDFGAMLPGYSRFDLRAAWTLASHWHLEVRIENLGDRDYVLVDGYNTPGRSGLLRVRWQGE
ncbi:TonB-dependent receptor domain-containing protein [Arenimonas sp.]|uniref:TonB-dependent receptor domain-containing protein n=1 Tax=Arenimonas sp. TaxID=1872635 RepID=UPI0039E36797